MQHAFDADPEPDAGRGLAAHLLDQTVVATAAADPVLRGVERLTRELERGARVVVEPAHQPRVDLVRDPEPVESVLHRLEVRARVLAQAFGDLRRVLDDVLPVGVLRVEHPQRVGGHALAERVAERITVLEQVGAQLLGVARPIGVVAHRVDAQRELAQAERPVEAVRERDDLDVELRVVDAERLGAHLEVLAEAALLGAFVAEVRGDVPDLPRHRRVVLREGARDAARCPRDAVRCGGHPCPRSRTSPCGRRRSTRPPAGTPRGARRSG